MAVDTAQYVGNLDETRPSGADFVYEGDDNLRQFKLAVRQSFPQVTGPVSATHLELSRVAGVTAPIQTQLDAKAPLASPALTGTPTAPTATAGDASGQLATTAFVQAATAAFAAGAYPTTVAIVTGTTYTAAAGQHVTLTNAAASTVSLPPSPAQGDMVWVTCTNGLSTNVIARNGNTIQGLSEDLTIDNPNASVWVRFISGSWRLV